MKTFALLKGLKGNGNHHAHCQLHALGDNYHLGQELVWLFSAQTFAHCLIHLVSLLPVLFGLAEWGHHHNHVTEIGEMLSYSFALNIILHIGLAVMVVIAQKIRSK